MIWNPPPASTPSGGTYTSYVANLSQAGGAAPSQQIMFDSITGLVWTRFIAGIYQVTKLGAFTTNKTYLMINNNTDQGTFADGTYVNFRRNSNNDAEIRTGVYNLLLNTLTLTDGVLLNTSVEIRIYP